MMMMNELLSLVLSRLCVFISRLVVLAFLFLWASAVSANGQDCGWYKPITMIGTISGSAESPIITWNDPEVVSVNCRDVNGNVILGAGSYIMDNEYYQGAQNLNPRVSGSRIYYTIRDGIEFSHTPKTWSGYDLRLNQWVSHGPQAWVNDWHSYDFRQIATGSQVTVHPNSVLTGDIKIPLTHVGYLYVWDSTLIRRPLIDLYVTGSVHVQGGCDVSPAALEIDFGDIKNTDVAPKKQPFTLTCKNASANGYDVYINGEKSDGADVRTHTSLSGVDVILSTEKISETDGGKIINMNLTASLEKITSEKPYGAFSASAFMDVRLP
ncbi:fimbrial protein [Serratia marcescens]